MTWQALGFAAILFFAVYAGADGGDRAVHDQTALEDSLAEAGELVDETRFVGTFRWCQISCLTIEIRPNRTFRYAHLGDVFNEISEGTWQPVGDGVISASTPPLPDLESPAPLLAAGDRLSILVSGTEGDTIPGATVRVACLGRDVKTLTDRDGVAAFEHCDGAELRLEVEMDGFRSVTADLPSNVGGYWVELAPQPAEIDALWYVTKDAIFQFESMPVPRVEGP